MTALGEACTDLAACLPQAAALLSRPDEDGTTGGGKPGSTPPWNPAAAAAYFDAREGILRTEASFRLAVNGHTGKRRGGSELNVYKALDAIENLGEAVTSGAAMRAARLLQRWVMCIEQLAAIDTEERPLRIAADCPYCGFGMLRVYPRQGRVTCLRLGSCFDADERHPVGHMEIGRLGAQVRWADGLVAP